jgi:2-succinyl-6-hydroxy-2,4-cyclohexadiene-1-carboxylate synthase
MVLIHGFAQNPSSWDEVVGLLPDGAIVAAPELPGHGETALRLGEPSPSLARDVVESAANEIGAPAVVWGYSQGVRVALDLALERPDMVSALILESGAAGIADSLTRAERRSRDEALARRIENEPIEKFVAFWEMIPALGEQSSGVVEKQRPARLSHDPAALAGALRGLGQAAYEPMWDRLAEIEVPVLIVVGGDDGVYGAFGRDMAGRLRDASLVEISGAGHAAHVSHPKDVTDRVQAWVASKFPR